MATGFVDFWVRIKGIYTPKSENCHSFYLKGTEQQMWQIANCVNIYSELPQMKSWVHPQGHHFSTQLKTPKTRNRKMAAAEVYK